MVSLQLAEQLKKVLAEDFGREVSIDEASQILENMTAYFDLLARLNHKIKKPDEPLKEDNVGPN